MTKSNILSIQSEEPIMIKERGQMDGRDMITVKMT